jgi:hypothetical protein
MIESKGQVSISRGTSSQNEEGYISITIEDKPSRCRVLEVTLDLKTFAECVTGLGSRSCALKVQNVFDKIGRKMEHRTFEVEVPTTAYENRERVASEIIERQCPEGWEPVFYFGSRDSFFTKDGKSYVKTTIRRWL